MLAAARGRIAAVRPGAYARNRIEAAVHFVGTVIVVIAATSSA